MKPGWQIGSIAFAICFSFVLQFCMLENQRQCPSETFSLSISNCDSRRVEASQCNRFILFAKVWVLWVPQEDEKVSTDYSDRAVAHESSLQEKNPTERKIQEYKEKRDQLWDWEDEQPAISGTSTSTGKRAAPAVGEGAVATVGNRKNTAKQMKRAPAIMPAHCNVTLEAAKYKAATIKD